MEELQELVLRSQRLLAKKALFKPVQCLAVRGDAARRGDAPARPPSYTSAAAAPPAAPRMHRCLRMMSWA